MRRWFSIVLAAVPLMGCSNPLVGSWLQKTNSLGCGKVELAIDDTTPLTGTGDMPLDDGGTCKTCTFELLVIERDPSYELDLKFDNCVFVINGIPRSEVELDCDLDEDADPIELICDPNFGEGVLAFEKIGG